MLTCGWRGKKLFKVRYYQCIDMVKKNIPHTTKRIHQLIWHLTDLLKSGTSWRGIFYWCLVFNIVFIHCPDVTCIIPPIWFHCEIAFFILVTRYYHLYPFLMEKWVVKPRHKTTKRPSTISCVDTCRVSSRTFTGTSFEWLSLPMSFMIRSMYWCIDCISPCFFIALYAVPYDYDNHGLMIITNNMLLIHAYVDSIPSATRYARALCVKDTMG